MQPANNPSHQLLHIKVVRIATVKQNVTWMNAYINSYTVACNKGIKTHFVPNLCLQGKERIKDGYLWWLVPSPFHIQLTFSWALANPVPHPGTGKMQKHSMILQACKIFLKQIYTIRPHLITTWETCIRFFVLFAREMAWCRTHMKPNWDPCAGFNCTCICAGPTGF